MRSLGLGLGASSARPHYDPASLPGVTNWLRSDRTVTVASSKASTWTDVSGSGKSFGVHGGSIDPMTAPGYTAGQYAGKPGINGVDGTRGLACSTLAAPGTSGTLVYVFSSSSLSASYIASDLSGANVSLIENFTASKLEWLNGSDRQTFATSLSAGLHQVIVAQVDSTSLVGYLDGVQVFSVTPVSSINHAPTQLFGYGAGANGTNGDIVEQIIVSGRAVTATEVALLHAYSKSFWNTP